MEVNIYIYEQRLLEKTNITRMLEEKEGGGGGGGEMMREMDCGVWNGTTMFWKRQLWFKGMRERNGLWGVWSGAAMFWKKRNMFQGWLERLDCFSTNVAGGVGG
jgi:hypothetical protein